MIELFKYKEDCCGCTACKNICPKNAITMKRDEEGFSYPSIDSNLCIECNLCKKICNFKKDYDRSDNFDSPKVHAVKYKDEKERMSSRSGGMFVAISDFIFNRNGIVYGASFDENFNVIHRRIQSKKERILIKGSKYVQSDLKDTFSNVKKDLEEGNLVLFSGTPCQTAGLKSYLKNNKNICNLYLCDIVCHGAPSPLIWKEYVNFIEKKYNDKLVQFDFRDKSFGWNTHIESFTLSKKNKKIYTEYYTKIFYEHLMLRPSCHNCKYTNFERPSDITIADFWGIEKLFPEFDDNKGVSLVLINSNKGMEIFNESLNDIYYKEANIDSCIQPNLKEPSKPSSIREQFWNDYYKKGFIYILKRYSGYGYVNKIKKKVKSIIDINFL